VFVPSLRLYLIVLDDDVMFSNLLMKSSYSHSKLQYESIGNCKMIDSWALSIECTIQGVYNYGGEKVK